MTSTEPLLRTDNPAGEFTFHPHPGQWRALTSRAPVVAVIAGTQGGKTITGPPWLFLEMRARGPGDYLVASPTFRLMSMKVLPEVRRFFERQMKAGSLTGGMSPEFRFTSEGEQRVFGARGEQPSRILFGHAADPDSLESGTVKAAWLDEAGQKRFRLGSYQAVRRRLAIHRGRVLITTTPYDLGWLKQKIFDPWKAAARRHQAIDVIQFRSVDNPAYPRQEYEDARRDLPGWRFRMFYDGEFDRPAGLIYHNFDTAAHVVPRFTIPPAWQRFVGLDFGAVNTAAVFLAKCPQTGRLYAYREYHAGNLSSAQHAAALLAGEHGIPLAVGGAPRTEDGWRDAFCAGGLPVLPPPVKDVEVGIDRVYATIGKGELLVFSDLEDLLDDMGSYSRETDESGEPLEAIEAKATWHRMDALRYIIAHLKPAVVAGKISTPTERRRNVTSAAPPGVFLS